MKPALAPQVLNRVYQAAARLQSANHTIAAMFAL